MSLQRLKMTFQRVSDEQLADLTKFLAGDEIMVQPPTAGIEFDADDGLGYCKEAPAIILLGAERNGEIPRTYTVTLLVRTEIQIRHGMTYELEPPARVSQEVMIDLFRAMNIFP